MTKKLNEIKGVFKKEDQGAKEVQPEDQEKKVDEIKTNKPKKKVRKKKTDHLEGKTS